MVELKTANEIAAMRAAGRVVAKALAACAQAAVPGVPLRDLDEVARGVLAAAGARSSFLDYHPHFAPTPFPAVLITSVNDVIVHGIPDDYRLADGDLLSIDFGAELDGFHGDAATSLVVGAAADPADEKLIETARAALDAGIAAATPGNRIGDVSHAIGRIGRDAGYGIPADFGGHGIGRQMHEPPSVPNEGRPGRGFPLRPGLVIAIEPMFISGGHDGYHAARDGWALCTDDRSRAAHVEHSVAITEDGPVVLTLP
ncbi:type I methionyl aminopeptidase [Actinopolymorpha rutila]|uniref:Methionine aminopeptidase n=1 Tax=Actinopolymorpha rutila TaxID=446787 RepID=A0A852Z691_9ACTN|nr:type I methionyl aminopeptidase [Actinopolymorpha rutila]NYH88411.1 methionyl aminopeptidase [Actinopolymorpha rutila]